VVLALFEARFLLTYVVIAQHCDNFNNSLDKHETLDKYKDFLELVINTNKMFSSSFLVHMCCFLFRQYTDACGSNLL
jgi:hypothetical protein